MATCYSSYELSPVAATQIKQQQPTTNTSVVQQQQKDYSRPLHVDCSVEYELPNQAKPPAGGRNEPLLMIHPCYFRKIESQRRSPFVNNLPTRQQQQQHTPQPQQAPTPVAVVPKRRLARGQQIPQQVPQQAAQYPVQYDTISRQHHQLWDHQAMAPLAPAYGKHATTCGYSAAVVADAASVLGHCWPEPADRSPDRPDDAKHILTGKYRQYLRAHRLHPYVPIASTFPQIHQQVCYNV